MSTENKCGCKFYAGQDPPIELCPLHAAAEGMLAFVRRVAFEPIGHAEASHAEILAMLTAEARALLRASEGK